MKKLAHSVFALLAAVALAAPALAQEATPPAVPKHENAARQPQQTLEAQMKAFQPLNQSLVELARASQVKSIIATVMALGLPVFIVAIVAFARHRRSQALHETLRLMVEKGVTIPPELLVPPKPAPNDFRRGVLLIALGAGLMALLASHATKGAWSVGLVPVLLGVGYLVVAKLGTKPPASSGPTIPA